MVDLFLIQVNGLGGNDNDNLKKAQMDFNDFFCHDAIIKNIIIDRNTPGINDNISFSLELPEKEDKINFIFEDVYWSAMELNFGISADETVFSAFCSADNNDLNKFYSKWKGLMNDVKLYFFEINLNSSGGNIKIIAKKFTVKSE